MKDERSILLAGFLEVLHDLPLTMASLSPFLIFVHALYLTEGSSDKSHLPYWIYVHELSCPHTAFPDSVDVQALYQTLSLSTSLILSRRAYFILSIMHILLYFRHGIAAHSRATVVLRSPAVSRITTVSRTTTLARNAPHSRSFAHSGIPAYSRVTVLPERGTHPNSKQTRC